MKSLEQALEDHDPLEIFPWGIEDRMCRGVGDGFVFSDRFFWLDAGWNDPEGGGGTGTEHVVPGAVSEGVEKDTNGLIHTPHWYVANEPYRPACIITLVPGQFPALWTMEINFEHLYEVALHSRALAIQRKGERYGSREAAFQIATDFMETPQE